MASIKLTERSSTVFDRLDDVQMSAPDRERAKAMMHQAEAFAKVVVELEERVSGAAVAVTRAFASFCARFRSALSHAAHR